MRHYGNCMELLLLAERAARRQKPPCTAIGEPLYPQCVGRVFSFRGPNGPQPIMSNQTIAVHLPDGAIREVPAGTTPFEIANAISPRQTGRASWRERG